MRSSAAITAIYDGVFGIPLADFQRFALARIGDLVVHDSAVWINGVSAANQVHSCLLVNQADDLIDRYMADYAGIELGLGPIKGIHRPAEM